MLKGKTILAIIPARGGSKRIPDKNIKLLYDKPLIAWTIETVKKSKLIDRLIVSTDSPKIAKVSQKYGAEIPFLRPAKLAQDQTETIPVLQHTVNFLQKKEKFYPDIVVLIQATSPLTRASDIDGTIKKLFQNNAHSSLSLCEAAQRPEWMFVVKNNKIKPYLPAKIKLQQSQKLPKVLAVNGAVYTVKTEILMKKNLLIDLANCAFFEMSKEHSIDIDDLLDFQIAEFLIKCQSKKQLK